MIKNCENCEAKFFVNECESYVRFCDVCIEKNISKIIKKETEEKRRMIEEITTNMN